MPTLENERLVFRFPQIERDASFSIDFQRTLRIPDSDKTYPLPPGLGSFPLRHVEDYSNSLSAQTASRGGVILPIWQAEAMWLNFENDGPNWDLDFPVAIKVAAGKINAITGENWKSGLHRNPQDYLVSPEQPWLDGFAIEKGVIRQFVAMPLGDGYSVEEQLTGEPEWGGLQISVAPLKADVWRDRKREWREKQGDGIVLHSRMPQMSYDMASSTQMGLAAGGRMRQVIYPDPFRLEDWDFTSSDRVFVTLVHAKDWKSLTGDAAPNEPPTAREYGQAGLPWFEHYGKDQSALPGSTTLAGVKSLADQFESKTGAKLPNSNDLETEVIKKVGPGTDQARPVHTSGAWED